MSDAISGVKIRNSRRCSNHVAVTAHVFGNAVSAGPS